MTNGISRKPSQVRMDETIQQFLREKVNSFIKWDLVRFFHDTPHAKDTAPNIARYIGRDQTTVERELAALASNGIVRAEQVAPDVTVYSLADDADTRQTIHRFMVACHDRNFRVKVINQVIQAMQFTPSHDF